MKYFFIIFLILLSASPILAQEREILWEGNMPNSKGITMTDSIDNARMRRVGTPHFFIFKPSKDENKGAAVIICPPGGYGHHTYDIAGFQLGKWFNTMGITAFVLMSRLPHSPDLIERETGPIQDAQRMMKIVRLRAAEWGIDPDKIGIMGCSAGGHLAATLSTYPHDLAKVGDRYDTVSVRPDFTILVSSVITMGEKTHQGSKRNLLGENPTIENINKMSAELNVTAQTPPAIIFHADDDPVVPSDNSILYYNALRSNGVRASLHIFPFGAHSIGLRNNPPSTQLWTPICEAWLTEMKIL